MYSIEKSKSYNDEYKLFKSNRLFKTFVHNILQKQFAYKILFVSIQVYIHRLPDLIKIIEYLKTKV